RQGPEYSPRHEEPKNHRHQLGPILAGGGVLGALRQGGDQVVAHALWKRCSGTCLSPNTAEGPPERPTPASRDCSHQPGVDGGVGPFHGSTLDSFMRTVMRRGPRTWGGITYHRAVTARVKKWERPRFSGRRAARAGS